MSEETHPLETYDGQLERLDQDYVRSLGEAIRARLFPEPPRDDPRPRIPMPVAVSYQPGNGTAYDLVFVPAAGIQQAGSEVLGGATQGIPRAVPSGCYDADGIPRDGYVLVAKANGTPSDFAYPFDLGFGRNHFVNYVGPNAGVGHADACAIVALFRAISGVEIRDDSRGGA